MARPTPDPTALSRIGRARRALAYPGAVLLLAALALVAVAARPGVSRAVDRPRPTLLAERAGIALATQPPAATKPAGGSSFRLPPVVDASDAPAAEHTPPFRLTASDGTGLRLVALRADAVLEPPLAFTELHLTFENPRDAVIEGRFQVALPSGAALSRFAMKIDGRWQEGEVVERQRARVAYEDFLHRRQDPALLEQEAGNEFSARVFPIPARGRKELVVSWSHALVASDEPYVLPLLGLPELGTLDARVLLGERPAAGAASNLGGEASERRVLELHRTAWTPDRDLVVSQGEAAPRGGLRHGELALVRIAPPVDAHPQEVSGLFVLVDSSASRALGWRTQVARVGELVAGLRDGAGAGTPVAVAAFDQEVVALFEGTAGAFATDGLERLQARRPLGASDLAGALRWLGERLAGAGGRYPRVLLVSDGVATAGDVETRDLRAAVQALRARGVERLDVLAAGALRDDAVLRELVTGNLPHDGVRLDAAAPAAEIARRLTLACRSGLELAVEGAAWSWPRRLDGVQPGDEVLVFAELPAGQPWRATLDGAPLALGGPLVTAQRPLLARAVAVARIDRLLQLRETELAGDADLRRAITLEATQLSIQHRVLTPFTALLVLETEQDYVRFGLERHALADILTVGTGGLEVLARSRSLAPVSGPEKDATVARREAPPTSRPSSRPAPRSAPPAPTERAGEARDQAEAEQLEALGYLGSGEAGDDERARLDDGDAVVVDGVPTGVEGGVAGGVAGGVVGGVAGGVPGGIPAAVTAESPVAPEPTSPVEVVEEVVVADAGARQSAADGRTFRGGALRVEPTAPPPPPGDRGAVEEQIAVDAPARIGRREREGGRPSAWEGRFAEVMELLADGRVTKARALAEGWQTEAPGDVLALLALGEACEASNEPGTAARAYGSVIDLFPSRADLRRLAGERLERLGGAGIALAVDTYAKAVAQRPDHLTGHRLLAWALLRAGREAEAFAALVAGIEQRYPGGRFAGADRVLAEDLGLLGAAWLRAEPSAREEVTARLEALGARLPEGPSLRFVLSWETDANDVDLHVWDRHGGHAYYGSKQLGSGGELFADVTTGYGPECFAIGATSGRHPGSQGGAYNLQAHYYSRGPMGYGMGLLQVIEHDGRGGLRVEPRPFVVMVDGAMVDLGTVEAPLRDRQAKADGG